MALYEIMCVKLLKIVKHWQESYDKPRQCVKKQRYHFADKDPYSQSYGHGSNLDVHWTDEWTRKLWYIYTKEIYSTIERNAFESFLMRWMNLEPIRQNEVSQKEKDKYFILMHI